MEKKVQIIIEGEDLNQLDRILGELPYKVAKPLVDLMQKNIKEVEVEPATTDEG